MTTLHNATAGANTGGGDRTAREPSLLVDVQEVAAMLQCSPRHVYRLTDGGRMPRPYKIGALCRWDRAAVLRWVSDGCPNCRKAVASGIAVNRKCQCIWLDEISANRPGRAMHGVTFGRASLPQEIIMVVLTILSLVLGIPGIVEGATNLARWVRRIRNHRS